MTAPPLRIDLAARIVTLNGQPIALSNRCFDLLAYLATRAGTAVPREQLLRDLWNWDASKHASAKTVDTHVSLIRCALGEARSSITTITGFGFRFEPNMAVITNTVPMPQLTDPIRAELDTLTARLAIAEKLIGALEADAVRAGIRGAAAEQ